MMSMRKIGMTLILAVCAVSLFAAPARRGWMRRTLSDGSSVEVQQIGDEYYHCMITREGKMLTMSEGEYVISDEPAPSAEQIALRRAQRAPKAVGKKNLAPRGLVVLAAFKDLPYVDTNDSLGMWEMMNKPGYDYEGATGSARDYFIAQSDSQYMPFFDVVGPVTLPQDRSYYGRNTSSQEGTDANAGQMIVDACKLVDNVVDFTLYDNDKNGEVDFVYVIYAGIGENDRNSVPEAIWAHNYTVASKNCYLDGKKLGYYACSGEIDGVTEGRNGIGVICHEFGHVIGLPDYYDTKYSTNFDNWLTPNFWSIMDQGCYNNGAKTPPSYSIFDKYFFGWATPKFLAKDDQRNITIGTGYDDAYQITGGTTLKPYTVTDTTFYIENRQQTGWDEYLPGHGMVVWQVVYNATAWNNNMPNNVAYKPRYTVLSAVPGPIGNEDGSAMNNPFPGAGNVTTFTPFEGCALTAITEENGVITFKFNGGKQTCSYEVISNYCVVSSEEGTLQTGVSLELSILPENGYLLEPDCWAVEMGKDNPLLVYGVDYTYDAETGTFRIDAVTDDVVILIEAKEDTQTGLEENQADRMTGKILQNGQLVIFRGNKRFNAQGIEIQ